MKTEQAISWTSAATYKVMEPHCPSHWTLIGFHVLWTVVVAQWLELRTTNLEVVGLSCFYFFLIPFLSQILSYQC